MMNGHYWHMYVSDLSSWRARPLAAKGLLYEVIVRLDATGGLHLPSGLSSLPKVLGGSWDELGPALADLLAQHELDWDDAMRILYAPHFSDWNLEFCSRNAISVAMGGARK